MMMVDEVNIFKDLNEAAFQKLAIEIFKYQYHHNNVYRDYVDAIKVSVDSVSSISAIPFLPIKFFKSHKIVSGRFDAEKIFESSGTTDTVNSKHYIKSLQLYEQSFFKGFEAVYGDVKNLCVIGLLPSYLERDNSSLVYMVNALINKSGHPSSGFYLNEYENLAEALIALEQQRQPTLLIGVTFALLDFAKKYPIPLQHTKVMETGGMKGRRKEMIRVAVQQQLKDAFQVKHIHSEYGMTELLSQAYSQGDGIFTTPSWMKILVRDEEDPLSVYKQSNKKQRGVINVIDLANIHSCSFIATDDLGVLYVDGSFEVLGRMDNSDIRGCSLLAL